MSKSRVIYFLSAIVLIIGCYALNLSYSLFVQTETKDAVTASVPALNSGLSITSINVPAGKEYLIKQKINNTSTVAMNYALNTSTTSTTWKVKIVEKEGNDVVGVLSENSSKEVYLYVTNTGTSAATINFSLSKSYATVSNTLTSNITETYTFESSDTSTATLLSNKILGKTAVTLDNAFPVSYKSNNSTISSSTATSTITFTPTSDGTISFDYRISSETTYDKFTVTLNSTTLLNGISGEQSGSINEDITSGTTYTLTLTYKKDGSVNKNEDMVEITNLSITSVSEPTVTTSGTYGFTKTTSSRVELPIISEATKVNSGTPDFTSTATAEEGIFAAEDDYGTSYYFRGASSVNYVKFAGFTWRIVRINGDGSIRLILDGTLDSVDECNSSSICKKPVFNGSSYYNRYIGYMYGTSDSNSATLDTTHKNSNSSNIKTVLEDYYEYYILDYQDYLSDTLFCGDKTFYSGTGLGSKATNYSAYKRLDDSTPTLKCAYVEGSLNENINIYSRYTSSIDSSTVITSSITGEQITVNNNLTYPIALITTDELMFAGATETSNNTSFYIYNSNISVSQWWTMTPSRYVDTSSGVYIHSGKTNTGKIGETAANYTGNNVNGVVGARPVINLRADILSTKGSGTSTSPYEVSLP